MPRRPRPQPRIAVPPALRHVSPRTGHGKVWHHVLAGLEQRASVRFAAPAGARVRLRRPDVWLADGHAGPLGVAEPVVVQVHEASWVRPQLRAHLPDAFVAELAPRTEAGVAAAARVITPSASSAAEIVDACGAAPERVHVVPHGVDTGAFRPGVPGGRALVAAARQAEEAPYVLFAALPYPRKNLPAVRQAMSALAARGLPHVLALAGGSLDGPGSEQAMRAVTAELPGAPGRIVWLRDVDDGQLISLMAGADAFCLPSFSEGFGLTALEAMACGAPVVVSDRGALPEVVGDAGLVVTPEPEAVEAALLRVLGEPRLAERLGEAGRRRAETFTWERTAQGWLAVVEQAAGERQRRALRR